MSGTRFFHQILRSSHSSSLPGLSGVFHERAFTHPAAFRAVSVVSQVARVRLSLSRPFSSTAISCKKQNTGAGTGASARNGARNGAKARGYAKTSNADTNPKTSGKTNHAKATNTDPVSKDPELDPDDLDAEIGYAPAWKSVFSMRAGLIMLLAGVGLLYYYRREKRRLQQLPTPQRTSTVVTNTRSSLPIGGPFSLIDQHGARFSSDDLKGRYALVYFGFTRCPDVCPDELDKMTDAVDMINKVSGDVVTPVFITCDPLRDPPSEVAEYLQDFHPKMVGLTGSYDEVKAACKAYRVYFSTPRNVDPEKDDYLVDHSVFIYLLGPDGKFLDVFGRNSSAKEIAEKVCAMAKAANFAPK
ncbi:copper chaperone Sco1 [Schizosaccharomyces japonicus yFS275]|uniref:Copper chaperone Sco1 n=1 Tax=Schizosaccharomyces japonicus (strain yFS275 / FY16936) TaxID=402676 RepID=B6K749_SCHJY|nr:copper chaperone Sco1 [Schizosaccharomyces japonicus yFS275]EEB09353.1 copper chaperone Sco1 [Schizosaccharomyces japonicus yFS275]